MPISDFFIPGRHRGIIDQHLTPEVRRTARGLYSEAVTAIDVGLPNTPTNLMVKWLSNSANLRPLAIANPAVVALILMDTEGITRLVSRPVVETPTTSPPYVVGVLGDSLASCTPVKLLLRDVIANVTGYVSHDFGQQFPSFVAPAPLANPIQLDEHVYALPEPPTFPECNPSDSYLANVPLVLPLQARHGVQSGLSIDDPLLEQQLQTCGHVAVVWMKTMRHLYHHHEGKALLATIPNQAIVDHLQETLPATLLPNVDQAMVPLSMLESDNLIARRLAEELRHIADRMFDCYVISNSDLITGMIPNIESLLRPPVVQHHIQAPPGLAATETKPKFLESTLSHRLMLTVPPHDTQPTYVAPDSLSPQIAHVFRSDKMGIATQRLQRSFETCMANAHRGNRSHLAYSIQLAPELFTVAFVTALLYATYHTGYLHQQTDHQRKTLISVTSLRAADASDQALSGLIALTNQLLNEDHVQELAQHASPLSKSSIYQDGFCSKHQHLVHTVANHIVYFALLWAGTIQEIQERTHEKPAIIQVLLQYFDKVTSSEFTQWMNSMLTQAPYLVIAFENELHNLLRIVYQFATDPVNVGLLNENKADQIDYTPLASFAEKAAQLQQRLDSTISSGSLGAYVAPPKQYTDALARAQLRTPAKKSRMGTDDEALPPKKSSPTNPRPSDPNKGFWVVTNVNGALPATPRLGTGRNLLCFAYSIRGKTCPRGTRCKYLHVSNPRAAISDQADRDALDGYVTANAGVDWAPNMGPLGPLRGNNNHRPPAPQPAQAAPPNGNP